MWPFSESRKVSTLEERLRIVESEQRALKGEWLLHYEKLMTLMGRIAKRAKLMEAPEAQSEEQEAEPVIVPTGSQEEGGAALFLTPRQRAIQAQVLRRRAARLERP